MIRINGFQISIVVAALILIALWWFVLRKRR